MPAEPSCWPNFALVDGILKASLHCKILVAGPLTFTLLSLYCPCHSPDAADSTSFDVQLGDIILTATDGLFDNMPDYMILQELKKLKVMSPL